MGVTGIWNDNNEFSISDDNHIYAMRGGSIVKFKLLIQRLVKVEEYVRLYLWLLQVMKRCLRNIQILGLF